MLPNGNSRRAYETSCQAAKHVSGWAMRNTNNHNTSILKKSCLGVLVCSSRHTTCPSRPAVHLKPAICHKARAKQIGRRCPAVGCDGTLELRSCSGLVGNPVTHFWRTEGSTVYFQAKGVHDHPPPDVYRRTSTSTVVQPRSRKRRNIQRAAASKSVNVSAKVKVEPPDEVTCSTDDVRRHTIAAEAAERESTDDALLPDTTVNIGDDVDDTADRIVTSFGGTYQSVSNRIVETVALGNHITTPQQQRMVPERTTSSVTSQQYGFYQQQYQYGSIPYVAPLYYGHDQATI